MVPTLTAQALPVKDALARASESALGRWSIVWKMAGVYRGGLYFAKYLAGVTATTAGALSASSRLTAQDLDRSVLTNIV